eukprot:PhM_4_TR13357/c0_g1_i1/m.92078
MQRKRCLRGRRRQGLLLRRLLLLLQQRGRGTVCVDSPGLFEPHATRLQRVPEECCCRNRYRSWHMRTKKTDADAADLMTYRAERREVAALHNERVDDAVEVLVPRCPQRVPRCVREHVWVCDGVTAEGPHNPRGQQVVPAHDSEGKVCAEQPVEHGRRQARPRDRVCDGHEGPVHLPQRCAAVRDGARQQVRDFERGLDKVHELCSVPQHRCLHRRRHAGREHVRREERTRWDCLPLSARRKDDITRVNRFERATVGKCVPEQGPCIVRVQDIQRRRPQCPPHVLERNRGALRARRRRARAAAGVEVHVAVLGLARAVAIVVYHDAVVDGDRVLRLPTLGPTAATASRWPRRTDVRRLASTRLEHIATVFRRGVDQVPPRELRLHVPHAVLPSQVMGDGLGGLVRALRGPLRVRPAVDRKARHVRRL